MRKNFILEKFCLILTVAIAFSCVSPIVTADTSQSVADLAQNSERFLSDFAVGSGGNVAVDDGGNVVFDINSSRHSLKFKCTGDSPIGEQNAICIWFNNRTGSSKMYVDIVFMRLDGEQYSVNYEKTVENSGSDVFLFVPSVPDEFVVSISLRAAGVGEGRFSIMGIWHCFYSFPESANSVGIGSLDRLEFTENGNTVNVEGTVLHDITISSRDSTINVYRLLPGEILSDELISEKTPVASSDMSRGFSFTVKNRVGSDYSSAYAVTINRPDGSIEYIIEDKLYPGAYYRDDETRDFKGVVSTLEYMPSEMSSEALMIDIDINKFVNDTLKGYLYSFGGSNYCFDSDTVDSIERRIASHMADGGSVYLRLNLTGDDTLKDYMLYDADGEAAVLLYAAVSFLCERFGETVDGFVAGLKFDTPYLYSNVDGTAYADYIRKYADLVSVMLIAARNTESSMKVVVPISSNNEFSASNEFGSDKYPMFSMLISFLEVYSLSSEGRIMMMLCDNTFPELPGDGEPETERTLPTKKEIMNLRVENVGIFEEFLDYLDLHYGVTDNKYIYMWHPFGSREENELQLAYMYTYFLLSLQTRLITFFCDFTPDEHLGNFSKSESMCVAINIMGGEGADEYAEKFINDNFSATFKGITGYDKYSPSSFDVESLGIRISPPVNVKGSYHVVDFGSPSSLVKWKKGAYADAIVTDSSGSTGRYLRATLNLPANSSEYAEIIYSIGKSADMSDVDAVSFLLRITGEDISEGTEYTVKIAIGSENSKGVLHYTEKIISGEDFRIFADTSKFEGMNNVSYIKISVQNNSGVSNKTMLHVGDITLYSTGVADEELAAIFAAENNENGESTPDSDRNADLNTLLIIFFGLSAISIIVVMVIRNREYDNKEE